MKQSKSYRFKPQDEKAIHLCAELGMPKNLAKTLMYISHVDECRSTEIEQGTKLRQPEVSVAMQQLQKKEWIEKRDLKKKGKGRPVYIYKLASSIEDIIKNFEKEKTQEIENIKSDLAELKSLLEDR